MRVLLIGGGVFVGRAITDALLASGHEVTHFHRGKSEAPRSDVETIVGDRFEHLDRLKGHTWDAVVDTCAYVPRAVGLSTAALADSAKRYLLISTVSVYDYDSATPERSIDESSPRLQLPTGADRDTMTPETYGALKALCEDVVFERFGDRALAMRCGLMVGPHDRSNRFTYWVTRTARGGRMLAPVGPESSLQLIDVRDVARFCVLALQRGISGPVNVTGVPGGVNLGNVLSAAVAVSGVRPEIVWLDRATIARTGLKPWEEIPLWDPDDRFMEIFHSVRVDRALAAGLRLRPLQATVRDTLVWAEQAPADRALPHGMTAEREAAALLAVAPAS